MHSQASQRNFSLKQDELSEHAPVQQGRDQFIRKPQTNLIQLALSVHTEHFYSCSVSGFLQHLLSSLQHLKTYRQCRQGIHEEEQIQVFECVQNQTGGFVAETAADSSAPACQCSLHHPAIICNPNFPVCLSLP